MEDPRDEKSRPIIRCPDCEGTGYKSMDCIYCGYNLSKYFSSNPNSILHYSPDNGCPFCHHRDCLEVCPVCNGEGKREMNDDELETFKNNQKYLHHEKL